MDLSPVRAKRAAPGEIRPHPDGAVLLPQPIAPAHDPISRRREERPSRTGERRAAAQSDSSMSMGPVISPDGIGRIVAGKREISFFLEYDPGTENHTQLENGSYR